LYVTQAEAVAMVLAAVATAKRERFLLYAGPGAGKTTTLVELIQAIVATDGRARVCFLTYTVAATRQIRVSTHFYPHTHRHAHTQRRILVYA
jgi:flagellar biosynthesis GTPase FlhF